MASGGTKAERKRSSNSSEEFLSDPLDVLAIPVSGKDGIKKVAPALSIGFMEPRSYVTYKVLPCLILPDDNTCTEADIEEWLERMALLEKDLSWLLKLPHQRFWCQVAYDENLQSCLQSYLSRSPRDYDLNTSVRSDILARQQRIHKLVFLVFLRMSTYKESKFHHITPHVFGELIYDSYIFDVPRMMDLAVLYGFRNQQIISKMIQNLFSTQPCYMDDLDECITSIHTALNTVEEKLGLRGGASTCSQLYSSKLSELYDVVNYLTDITASLYCFFEAYPLSGPVFYKCGTCTRMPSFYDLIFPPLENNLKLRKKAGESENIVDAISRKVVFSKSFLVKAFRNLITSCCIHPVLNARCEGTDEYQNTEVFHLENFLQLFTEIATEKIFLNDYNKLFPFSADLEIFSEAGISIDVTSLNYILSGIQNPVEANSSGLSVKRKLPKKVPSSERISNMQELAASLNSTKTETKNGDNDFYGAAAAAASKSNEVQIISLVHMVLDIFPDLGEGFVEACLEYYNLNFEKVVDALITDTLPSSLATIDRSLKRKVPDIAQAQGPPLLLNERKSIFDYDEFDVFNREDVAVDRIHMGKSGKTPGKYGDLHADKDSVLLKELTLKYEEDLEEDENYKEELNLYEDEYDDTYDSHPVTLMERQPENELLRIRPFTTPIALRSLNKKGKVEEDDEEEEEEIEETVNSGAKVSEVKDEFCINPEILRQKAEERRLANLKNRPARGGAQVRTDSSFKNKERHKGQVSNHSRRKQSDFKKSRGMCPFPTR